MLKLNKKIDYALMALNFMACQEEGSVANTRMISEIYNIPPELLAKTLQILAKKGIIVSQNGPKGGYSLAKAAHLITVGEVIRAIEGPVHIIHCTDGASVCSQMERCTVYGPLKKIEGKIVDLLEQTTLDQLYQEGVQEEIFV